MRLSTCLVKPPNMSAYAENHKCALPDEDSFQTPTSSLSITTSQVSTARFQTIQSIIANIYRLRYAMQHGSLHQIGGLDFKSASTTLRVVDVAQSSNI